MIISIRRIIRGIVAPSAVVVSAPHVWHRLVGDLNERSGGIRESGAFLLGTIENNGTRTILDYVLYDDLDPEALNTGAIHLRSSAYSDLWNLCASKNFMVVADVHTHPGPYIEQSQTDKRHPMISKVGHIAIILPNYGRTPTDPKVAAVYRYLGSYEWQTLQTGRGKSRALYVGRWA